jgi:hypothetical protein
LALINAGLIAVDTTAGTPTNDNAVFTQAQDSARRSLQADLGVSKATCPSLPRPWSRRRLWPADMFGLGAS